jgi:hypothetical protein
MVVRQNESLLIYNHSGTEAPFGIRRRIRRIKKAIEEILELIVLASWRLAAAFRLFNHLSGRNVHDRGSKVF